MDIKTFLVEDNATSRDNLAVALEELTCVRVVGSAGGEDEAHAWLDDDRHPWDMVIVDLFLKAGSGLRLAKRLSVRRPHRKVVVFSNYVNAAVRKRCAQVGVDAVFDKSTEIDALVDYCARQCVQAAALQPAHA